MGGSMRRVTAAVIVEDGRLLLTRRPPGDHLAGFWELPGGKVELGESPEQCLERELLEELDMRSHVVELLATTVYHYEHGSFELLAYRTERLSDYQLNAHDRADWVAPSELAERPLAPADVVIIGSLLSSGAWS